ncbi:flagellar assembly protein FliW [Candidatus Odyssella thessalonicensis]|uniref:flagellar assembly protein FliW n=1 Tax=Candidatus Odyssella thessalonicensis TaxID=84647 RepID=UPI0002EFD1CF|nr:flagellar assembly protein FliW [Candidatus Odyssella thessalonicensis]
MMNCEQLATQAIESQLPVYRLIMPQGIIGFNDINHYTLTPLVAEEVSLFWELQSIEEQEYCFILLKLDQLQISDITIAEADLMTATKHLGLELPECQVFLIVSVDANEDGQKTMTANIRAPFIFHPASHRAWQVILNNPDYPIAKII